MIQIFITGGTFDKSYNYLNGELFFKKTHLPEMLETSRCKLDVEVETLMMIDSLDIKSSDIKKIVSLLFEKSGFKEFNLPEMNFQKLYEAKKN